MGKGGRWGGGVRTRRQGGQHRRRVGKTDPNRLSVRSAAYTSGRAQERPRDDPGAASLPAPQPLQQHGREARATTDTPLFLGYGQPFSSVRRGSPPEENQKKKKNTARKTTEGGEREAEQHAATEMTARTGKRGSTEEGRRQKGGGGKGGTTHRCPPGRHTPPLPTWRPPPPRLEWAPPQRAPPRPQPPPSCSPPCARRGAS